MVHFEVIGPEPGRLRAFYADLFGWALQERAPVAPEVSAPDEYAFVEPTGDGVPAGIGGGPGFEADTVTYIGVADVEAALQRAEALGGTRVLGPAVNREGGVVVGHLRDPAGNLVGVAAPL